jgi:hypothetical protein
MYNGDGVSYVHEEKTTYYIVSHTEPHYKKDLDVTDDVPRSQYGANIKFTLVDYISRIWKLHCQKYLYNQ